MKIKLAIFDLDGTLLDTIEDLGRSCNHALEQCGYPTLDLAKYNKLVGRGIYNLFRGALPEGAKNEENVLKMKSFFIPYYTVHKSDYTKPYPGIVSMLEKLEAKGIALAIASNKYQQGTEELVKKYFPERRFVKISGQIDGKPIKPDPEIVFESMKAYGNISPDEVLYAGDSDVDMQTGINAGVTTAAVAWGFRTREELLSYSPWILAESAEELTEAILKHE